MEYLKARKEDVKECVQLKKEVLKRLAEEGLNIRDERYPSDELIEEDIINGKARIIKENDEIIAFATFEDTLEEFGEYIFEEENLACFSRLMDKTGHLRKHVAQNLIKGIINEAKERGYNGVGILVHPININALKMYEKLGFKFEKRKEYEFGVFDSYIYIDK